MPRLSLWRENQSNDFKFFDRNISEQFTVGGTGVLVHKYLGTKDNPKLQDATQPHYANQSEQNIQDLLFLENRDRKYDTSVYSMRGIYQVSDSDFDLTQFGLFLQTGTLFMTFHINDMVANMGRRIMSGDVIELLHLKDYDALNDLPVALKRFFIVGDCSKSSEGFSPTWWPHLWRCKINPMIDSQEYKDILNQIQTTDEGDMPLRDIISTYNKYVDINSAVVEQAEVDLPASGYDTSMIYIKPLNVDGTVADPKGVTTDSPILDASSGTLTADRSLVSPDKKIKGYLTGDGLTPNGLPVVSGISFPPNAMIGDYCLRVDYMPNRLFRFDGRRWTKVEDAVRTNLTPGAANNHTLRSGFVNNTKTRTDENGNQVNELQGLSQALRPQADNL
jgi:hypothetical protein